ncbi:phage holin family protein [Streptomyces sp. NPDC046909]|uniref:phage holin family protein n=1 Tax=Streptomyces sp. NPDC046909 TaxID=3155617 RepID=UPI0033FB929E
MYQRRRILGTYLGVGLAAALLPGISPVDDGPFWQTILACIGFLIVNQVIHTYPSSIRTAPPVALLALAAVGIVQDSLVWLLVSWLSGQMGSGLHVDGFLTALLGGAITRVTTLAVMALGPRPEPA